MTETKPQPTSTVRDLYVEHAENGLRAMASRIRRKNWNPEGVQTGTLLQETFLKLDRAKDLRISSPSHFLNLVRQAMHQVLANASRDATCSKRRPTGGLLSLTSAEFVDEEQGNDGLTLILAEALKKLAAANPEAYDVFLLHTIAGFTVRETAETCGYSERKTYILVRTARMTLRATLEPSSADG